MSEEFQDLLRAEMEQVEAAPRAGLVREAHRSHQRRRKQVRHAAYPVWCSRNCFLCGAELSLVQCSMSE